MCARGGGGGREIEREKERDGGERENERAHAPVRLLDVDPSSSHIHTTFIQSFMLSWITDTNERNITCVDSNVIHVEHDHDYGDNARPSVIGSVHGGKGRLTNISFSNITVEGDVYRPFGFVVQPNQWGAQSDGSIDGISLLGVRFLGKAKAPSIIHGTKQAASSSALSAFESASRVGSGTGMVSSVAFHGLSEDGVVVRSGGKAFVIDSATTSSITFTPTATKVADGAAS